MLLQDQDATPLPILGPECQRDYLTLVGLGLLCLTFVGVVALCLPLLTGR